MVYTVIYTLQCTCVGGSLCDAANTCVTGIKYLLAVYLQLSIYSVDVGVYIYILGKPFYNTLHA